MLEIIDKLDMKVLNFVYENLHTHILDRIMPIITFLGDGGMIWIIICIILLITKKHRKAGIILACSLILSAITGNLVLKPLIHRARPFTKVPGMKLLIEKPLETYSFPSGHSGSSFAAAGAIAHYSWKHSIPFFILASLIAFSRMYLYVHYPLDVVAGAILGLTCSHLSAYFAKYFFAKNSR